MQERQRSQPEDTFMITAKTILGLEEVLAEEIRQHGGKEVELLHRGVKFKGNKEVLYTCNYNCRTALRFLVPQWEFRADNDSELYENCLKFPWDAFMGLDNTFAI